MALKIYMDVAGNFITQPSLSVISSLAKGFDPALVTYAGAWQPPGGLGITLQPYQVTAGWATRPGKLGLADFLHTATLWEQVDHRAAGDHFCLSKGGATEPLITKTAFSENWGLWCEFFAYGDTPHSRVRDLVILSFGQHFKLHVHSDGTADLTDDRLAAFGAQGVGSARPPSASQYLVQGAALSSGAASLLGRFVQIGVLPWRRGRLLVWSSLGGSFEAYAGERQDPTDTYKARRTSGETVYHITTEAAQATLDFSKASTAAGVTPIRAFGTVNPLTYPLTGTVTSPTVALAYPVTVGPSAQGVQAEQQDGTAAALSLTDGKGNPFVPSAQHPAQTLAYTVTLTSPEQHAAPVVFGANIDFDRMLGSRTYITNALGSPLSASLSVSRDRGQKSFSFTIDNPHDTYTTLKDLWNRKIEARIESAPDTKTDALGTRTTTSIDPVSYTLFQGLTDPADFTDGSASRLTIPCSGLRKQLRSHLLSDAKNYDGMLDTDAVRSVLHDAGIDPANMVIDDADGTPLDSADPGEDPLWRPANGTSADEFICHICDSFSGWVFDDIGGKFYYVPRTYFSEAAILQNAGVPEVFMTTPLDAISHAPTAAARGPNAATLVALAGSVKQSSEEPRANDFWVLGRDSGTGDIIAAHYEDQDSIGSKTLNGTNNPNYIGERRLMIYASASITTLYMAQRTLGVLVARLGQPVRTVSFALPDWQGDVLPVEGPVYLQGYGYGLVTGIDATWQNDRYRVTNRTVELL